MLIPIAETINCGVGVSSSGTVSVYRSSPETGGGGTQIRARAQHNCPEKPNFFLRSQERRLRLNIVQYALVELHGRDYHVKI